MTVLILAAGKQTRWHEGNQNAIAKQLVEIAGQPLLERTINQARNEWKCEPVVVTNRGDLAELATRTFTPMERQSTLHTLRSTKHLWRERRTVVLLGDVVYSPEAIARIALCDWPIIFFGRKELRWRLHGKYYEFFALTFSHDGARTMSRMIEATIAKGVMQGGRALTTALKIRGLYEFWTKLPAGQFQHEDTLFYPIEDWTEDIDAIEDYQAFVNVAVKRGWCNACYNGR